MAAAKKAGAKNEDPEVLAQEVADWSKNEWIRGWASMDPTLTDVDLRPYVFVTRDKRGAIGGSQVRRTSRASWNGSWVGNWSPRGAVAEVAKLSPQELDEVFGAVSDQVLQADDLKTEPKGIQGCWSFPNAVPEMERRLLDFGKALDIAKVGVWPVTMVATLKDPALVTEAKAILATWAEQDGNTTLKNGVKAMGSLAKKA